MFYIVVNSAISYFRSAESIRVTSCTTNERAVSNVSFVIRPSMPRRTWNVTKDFILVSNLSSVYSVGKPLPEIQIVRSTWKDTNSLAPFDQFFLTACKNNGYMLSFCWPRCISVSFSGMGGQNFSRPAAVSPRGKQNTPRQQRNVNQSGANVSKVRHLSSPGPPSVVGSSDLAEANHCRYCGKKFAEIKKLREHESYHKRIGRFKCQYCLSPFHTKANVVRHEKTHTDDKPYKCRICGQGFVWLMTCMNHEKTHKWKRLEYL